MKSVATVLAAHEDELPAYARVKLHLRERIHAGILSQGDQLPTQSELCKEFGVSRITVVRALQDLESEGLVERRQGVGTFVAAVSTAWSLTNVSQLYKQTFEPAGQPVHRIMELDTVRVHPARIGTALRGAGDLYRIVRLRIRDGRAVSYEESYVPTRAVPAGKTPRMLENMLLFDFMTRECGHVLISTRVYIAATTLSEEVAALLRGHAGDAALLITRVTYGSDGRPATFSLNTLPADESSYYFEFHHEVPSLPDT